LLATTVCAFRMMAVGDGCVLTLLLRID